MMPRYPVAVLPLTSLAVTVTELDVPALMGSVIPVTVKLTAAVACTVILFCTPVIVPVTVSVAVTDCSPAVFKVTPPVKIFTPLSIA